jgi:hypothetical protein
VSETRRIECWSRCTLKIGIGIIYIYIYILYYIIIRPVKRACIASITPMILYYHFFSLLEPMETIIIITSSCIVVFPPPIKYVSIICIRYTLNDIIIRYIFYRRPRAHYYTLHNACIVYDNTYALCCVYARAPFLFRVVFESHRSYIRL